MNKLPKTEIRTEEQLREHYEIEKELASKLRNATAVERKTLYSDLYNEMYRRVPHHPQFNKKFDAELRNKEIKNHVGWLERYFSKSKSFMELGPGDCLLSFELCKYFKDVYAIDVSDEITKNPDKPENFKLFLSDGSSVDVQAETIDVAFSNQLMEHLHPDDALAQIQGIFNALKSGGVYLCVTPHRFKGPGDISRYFDDVATGFHLKEYTNKELCSMFKSAGFRKINSMLTLRGFSIIIPSYIVIALEMLIKPLPHHFRKKICSMWVTDHFLSIKLIAIK